jgi:RimJ/RimL family protein N-acetyltransferase
MVGSLVGARLELRPYAAGCDDAALEALYRWSRDPEVLWLSGGVPVALPFARFRELFLAQLAGRNSDREQQFLILESTGRLIGRAGLFGMLAGTGSAELGIVIGERDRWGLGYGREAVRLLTDFGFGHLGLDRIVLRTYPENDRARRAFAAAGFHVSGERAQFSLDRGSHRTIEMVLWRDGASAPRQAGTARQDRQADGADGGDHAVAADRRP